MAIRSYVVIKQFGTDSATHTSLTAPIYHGDPLAMYDLNCETAATATRDWVCCRRLSVYTLCRSNIGHRAQILPKKAEAEDETGYTRRGRQWRNCQ